MSDVKENTPTKEEEQKPTETTTTAEPAKEEKKENKLTGSVFSMFGGGAPKKREEPKEDEEADEKKEEKKEGVDVCARSSSLAFATPEILTNKLQEEAPESPDVHFDPVVTLEKSEVKTHEESEEQTFKMQVPPHRLAEKNTAVCVHS